MVLVVKCVIVAYYLHEANARNAECNCCLHQTLLWAILSMQKESQLLAEAPSVLTPRSEEIDQKPWHRSAMAVDDQRY